MIHSTLRVGDTMCSLQTVQATHTTLPFKAALSLRSTQVKRCLHSVRCSSNPERQSERCSTGHLLTLAASIAPLLIPLQAFSEDQVTLADAGIPSSEFVRYEVTSLDVLCTSGYVKAVCSAALPQLPYQLSLLELQPWSSRQSRQMRTKR